MVWIKKAMLGWVAAQNNECRSGKKKKKGKCKGKCASGESNPGQYRGRVLWYHYTRCASWSVCRICFIFTIKQSGSFYFSLYRKIWWGIIIEHFFFSHNTWPNNSLSLISPMLMIWASVLRAYHGGMKTAYPRDKAIDSWETGIRRPFSQVDERENEEQKPGIQIDVRFKTQVLYYL